MTKRIRVLFITNSYPTKDRPERGIFNYRAVAGLSTFCDVGVLFLRTWKPRRPLIKRSAEEGWPLIQFFLPMVPLPLYGIVTSRLTAAPFIGGIFQDWDILHSVSLDFPGVLASYWARRWKLPHLAQVIGSDVNQVLPQFASHPLLKAWREGVSLVLCNSHTLAAVSGELLPAVRHEVAYRGTDLQRFHSADRSQIVHGFRFLYLGGLPPSTSRDIGLDGKGGVTLMRAWSMVEAIAAVRGACLLFGGPFADRAETREWRQGLRHPETVELLGQVRPDSVPALMRGCSAVLLPSRAEGLPNVAVEASASGCAVLGSRVGGVPEVVEDGVTGRLLPPADAAAWAQALETAMAYPADLEAMGRAARCRAETLFDARSYPGILMGLYHELLAAHSR
jgi:glycosyltransferase involved in cell wall biosynthesis